MEIEKTTLALQLKRAKKGNQSAYRFLLDAHWNLVYGFQLKRVRNPIEAEDITIETFAKAFDRINTYDEAFTFSTWLIAISKNIQIDKTRKKNAAVYTNTATDSDEQLRQIADTSPTPEDILITEQNLAQLLRYIKILNPMYQEVIQLRYFQEMTYDEIAISTKETLNNVKVRLLRAKKLLAEIITNK